MRRRDLDQIYFSARKEKFDRRVWPCGNLTPPEDLGVPHTFGFPHIYEVRELPRYILVAISEQLILHDMLDGSCLRLEVPFRGRVGVGGGGG